MKETEFEEAQEDLEFVGKNYRGCSYLDDIDSM